MCHDNFRILMRYDISMILSTNIKRVDTSMTSALGGVGQNVTIVLIGCVNGTVTRGGGGPKIRKFCGRHLSIAPKASAPHEPRL